MSIRRALATPIASVRLGRFGRLRRLRGRVGRRVRLDDGGDFVVFRDTSVVGTSTPQPAVLAVRFHLRFTCPAQRRLHRLFQFACVMTTPFFAGLRGYRTKLWMYDERTGDYAGLYQWDGAEAADDYARRLVPILEGLSTRRSVSYRLYPGLRLAEYLGGHRSVAPTDPGRVSTTDRPARSAADPV